jgi:hypothetical protein
VISATVIAQLRVRAAQLELKAAELDVTYPGEGVAATSRRYRNRVRLKEQAEGYQRLVELAEKENASGSN